MDQTNEHTSLGRLSNRVSLPHFLPFLLVLQASLGQQPNTSFVNASNSTHVLANNTAMRNSGDESAASWLTPAFALGLACFLSFVAFGMALCSWLKASNQDDESLPGDAALTLSSMGSSSLFSESSKNCQETSAPVLPASLTPATSGSSLQSAGSTVQLLSLCQGDMPRDDGPEQTSPIPFPAALHSKRIPF